MNQSPVMFQIRSSVGSAHSLVSGELGFRAGLGFIGFIGFRVWGL